MAEEKFKLPGSSYEEICKIIKAFGYFDKPFSLDEASQVCKMDKANISRNNGFLASVGIIEGDRTKSMTPRGKELARALEFERGDEILNFWREVVISNEFLSKMLAAVRIRKGMDLSTLQSHVAYSAGQQKTRNVMTGAKAIIDILLSAGLLREKDGQLVANEKTDEQKRVSTNAEPSSDTQVTTLPIATLPVQTVVFSDSGKAININLNIEIRIDAKPNELEGLGSKLRKILEDFSSLNNSGSTTNDKS